MFETAVLSLLMQLRVTDPVRSAEEAEMLLRARTAIQISPNIAREAQDRNFESKFNALIKALSAFSKKYNEGSGQLWPTKEAEALRKALTELQRAPMFRARRDSSK